MTPRIRRFSETALLVTTASLLLASCDNESISVVDREARLSIRSLFAINGSNSVTLGWTPPEAPLHPRTTHTVSPPGEPSNGPSHLDPADPGAPSAVLIYRGDTPDFQLSTATLLAAVDAPGDRYTDSAIANGETRYYRAVPVGTLANGLRKYGPPTAAAVGQPYDYSAVTSIRYGEHIDRILQSTCAVSGCHVGSGTGNDYHAPAATLQSRTGRTGLVPMDHPEIGGQFSMKSWEDLIRGGNHGAVVVAYTPTKSHLVFHVNDDTTFAPASTPHMPLPGFQLPTDQVRTLHRWIAEGCINDQGAVPFSVFPRGRVLITNQAEDLVAVIDRATNLVARYVRAGVEDVSTVPPEAPHNVTIDEARGLYYVNLVAAGKVLKYRLADNALLDEVGGITSPTQVILTPGGDTAYVAQFAAGVNAIKILLTNPMQVIGEISALNLDKPHGVQITPDGTELWVTGNLSDNIMVVTLAGLSTRLIQLNNQPPGQGGELLPYQTVMTSDKVYVTCQRGNMVLVVDRATSEVVARIPVGANPLIPAITPDGRFVIVPNRNSGDLSIIDTGVDSVVRTIANVGPQPHGAAITPDGRFAYISCENVTAAVPPHHPTSGSTIPGFFTVVDLATMTTAGRYEIGAFAAGVAISDR